MRGSRKHLLEWACKSSFQEELTKLIGIEGVEVCPDSWYPNKNTEAEVLLEKDYDKVGLCREHAFEIRDWWLAHPRNANTPNWDLAARIQTGERNGYLLVEAKAHETELNKSGKQELDDDTSDNSTANHKKIEAAVAEASRAWNREASGTVRFSIDSHYQLANRMAYAYKLASMGYDVILMYLGFIGDTYFEKDYFRTPDHWQRAMGKYMAAQIPVSLPDASWTTFGNGRAKMLVSSRCL